MVNRIIVPANYTFEVIIKVDPVGGQSELLVRNRSKVQVSMWQVAGLLAEHTSNMMKSLLMGSIKPKPAIVEETSDVKPNGGDNNAT